MTAPRLPTGSERVRVLYEEYIQLRGMQAVWEHPVSEKPELEPCFSSAFHGIELSFLLLSEFLKDARTYVCKRARIERVAEGIRSQCQLLSDIIDGELEEEHAVCKSSLTQDFPFEHCPPTTVQCGHSPGVSRLVAAVAVTFPSMSTAMKNSLIKVVLNITSAFASTFQRWTVGLGIEHQLNELLLQLELPHPPLLIEKTHNLDYTSLVRPQVAEATLSDHQFSGAEDFFFRTVHLGTECWMFVAINRLVGALQWARMGRWHVASARILQAARVLHYLGQHILQLCGMNLRDYLLLKVELEGTSGAGSTLVKAIRPHVQNLLEPLMQEALAAAAAAAAATAKETGQVAPAPVVPVPVVPVPAVPAPFAPAPPPAPPPTSVSAKGAEEEGGGGGGVTVSVKAAAIGPVGVHAGATVHSEPQMGMALGREASYDPGSSLCPFATAFAPEPEQLQFIAPPVNGCGQGNAVDEGRGATASLCPFHTVPPSNPGPTDGPGAVKGSAVEVKDAEPALLRIYEDPDGYAELYNYAKALEDVESALTGGFFFSHYMLAANVIGSESKGTMKRAVVALRSTYERQVFPILDRVRSSLGRKMDAQLIHVKGRIMDEIMKQHFSQLSQ